METASDNMFCQIDGVKGEHTHSDHKEWIHVLSFNHSIDQPKHPTATLGPGTSQGCHHANYSITKYVDVSSPKLYELCSSGDLIENVKLEFLSNHGEKKHKYMEVHMEKVIISHVAPHGGGAFPTESVSFNYGKIKWVYTRKDRGNSNAPGQSTGGWSLTDGKKHA